MSLLRLEVAAQLYDVACLRRYCAPVWGLMLGQPPQPTVIDGVLNAHWSLCTAAPSSSRQILPSSETEYCQY